MPDGYSIEVFLVDDGSTDGTNQAIHENYPQVSIINGDGNLYWNGGMRVAFNLAIEKGFDYYLWLNDDTFLYSAALQSLIKTSNQLTLQEGKGVIVVGSSQDEFTRKISYGGLVRSSKWIPTNFSLVSPSSVAVECETMNGNCVLIPNSVVRKVGNLEPGFIHSMGDLDYGLRARYEGFLIWIMPGFAGTCSENFVLGSFNDANLPVTMRLCKMIHPKGLPFSAWRIFTQRHAGIFWPIFWLMPYVKVFLKGIVAK